MIKNFNYSTLLLILATCIIFISFGYLPTNAGLFLILFVLMLYKNNPHVNEPYQDAKDKTGPRKFWNTHFQEKVLFYNSPCFLNANYNNNNLSMNCNFPQLKYISPSLSWENFVLEDARMGYGTYRGNTNQIPYNSPFYIQTQARNSSTQLYVSWSNNRFIITDVRNKSGQFVLIPKQTDKKFVQFGDSLQIKHLDTGNFVKKSNTEITASQTSDASTEWIILNQMAFGYGIEVDWARNALATMSSLYKSGNYVASNCNDGDSKTFCHTNPENDGKSPFFELHLPQIIDIQKISILNRQDCCKDRLGMFVIYVYLDTFENNELKSKEVYRKENIAEPTQNEFVLNDIFVIGNRVRVQLTDTGATRILNLATVSVFGEPVDDLYNLGIIESTENSESVRNSTNFILTKPLLVKKTINIPIIPNIIENFGLHFLISVNQNTKDNLPLFNFGPFMFSLNQKNKLVVKLTVGKKSKKLLTSKSSLKLSHNNGVSFIYYSGINASNGWTKVQNNSQFYILNLIEKKYFLTDPLNTSEYEVSEWLIPEQYQFLGKISEDFENVPFIKIFINEKLDTFTSEITIPAINVSILQLMPFSGTIGPFYITNSYVDNSIQQKAKTIFENEVALGSFDITERKQIPSKNLPEFGLNGASVSFWLNSTGNVSGSYCILNKKNNFVIQYNNVKYQLEFYFTTIKNKVIALHIPFGYTIIPMKWNNIILLINNEHIKILLNGKVQVEKKISGNSVRLDNVEPLIIGNCFNDSIQPLDGKINNLRVANYVYTKKSISDIQNRDPSDKVLKNINQVFHATGCPAKLDFENNPQLQNLYVSTDKRNPGDLVQKFKNIKSIADDFIANPQLNLHTMDKLSMVEICYGKSTRNVVQRLLRVNKEILDTKRQGEHVITLLYGVIDGGSKTVIGPKILKSLTLDNLKITFDINITELPVDQDENIFAFKFIQNRKHAYVPQLFIDKETGQFSMDIFTSQGIENVTIPQEIPLGVWNHIEIVFQKGSEVNFYFNKTLVDTKMTIGQILVSNLLEVILGKMEPLNGFNGSLMNLQVSYNSFYSSKNKTENIFRDSINMPQSLNKQIKSNLDNALSLDNKNNQTKFSVHFWLFYRSTNEVGSLFHGYINDVLIRVALRENMEVTLGKSMKKYIVKLPSFTFNQWNYLSFLIDKNTVGENTNTCVAGPNTCVAGPVVTNTNLLIFINENTPLGLINHTEELNYETQHNSSNSIIFGISRNSFIKDVKLSNYVLNKNQIIDFMNNRKPFSMIDLDNLSLLDIEKQMEKAITSVSEKKGAVDSTLGEKCFVIENNWKEFKSKNSRQSSTE